MPLFFILLQQQAINIGEDNSSARLREFLAE